MRILKFGGLYFIIVFVVGYVVGVIRSFPIFPEVGKRGAAIVQAPLMFALILAIAGLIFRRGKQKFSSAELFYSGLFALFLMLCAGYFADFGLSGISPSLFLSHSDWTTRAMFLGGLGVFTFAPLMAGTLNKMRFDRPDHS